MEELPIAYRTVRLYRLPLRGRHAQWSCPTNVERTLAVGRDDSARRCRNYRAGTNLVVYTVCRFAVGLDMSKPYRFCSRCCVRWGESSPVPNSGYSFGKITIDIWVAKDYNICVFEPLLLMRVTRWSLVPVGKPTKGCIWKRSSLPCLKRRRNTVLCGG